MSLLAVEGLDIFNVPENGFLLAGNVTTGIGGVGVLLVVGRKEIHLPDKF